MIKGTIQQEDIVLVNRYALNIGAPVYVRQILIDIKGETDRNTVILDFNRWIFQAENQQGDSGLK